MELLNLTRVTAIWFLVSLMFVPISPLAVSADQQELPEKLIEFAMRSGYKTALGWRDGSVVLYMERAQADYLGALRRYGADSDTVRKVAYLFAYPEKYDFGDRLVHSFSELERIAIREAFKLYFNEQKSLIEETFSLQQLSGGWPRIQATHIPGKNAGLPKGGPFQQLCRWLLGNDDDPNQ